MIDLKGYSGRQMVYNIILFDCFWYFPLFPKEKQPNMKVDGSSDNAIYHFCTPWKNNPISAEGEYSVLS